MLLHVPSRSLFAGRAVMEVNTLFGAGNACESRLTRTGGVQTLLSTVNLAKALDRPQSPIPATHEGLPLPSPNPSTTGSSCLSPDPSTTLYLALLDTLLCSLVDQPAVMRRFERSGGLKVVVGVLKDKQVAKVVR